MILHRILERTLLSWFSRLRYRTIAWRLPSLSRASQSEIAVIIPTVCRLSLLRAARSVFTQDLDKPIQLLIGVDVDQTGESIEIRKILKKECPPHIDLIWWQPNYSTSKRNGGVHHCLFGGSLRSALSFLANSEIITYLDDDDWYAPNHLREILKSIERKPWAYSLCRYADGTTGQELAIDEIESVGVNAGIYRDRFGGFVRPSALALNKIQLGHVLHLWAEALGPGGDGEDRLIFEKIKQLDHGFTGIPTVYYALDPKDRQHAIRMSFLQSKGIQHTFKARCDSVR